MRFSLYEYHVDLFFFHYGDIERAKMLLSVLVFPTSPDVAFVSLSGEIPEMHLAQPCLIGGRVITTPSINLQNGFAPFQVGPLQNGVLFGYFGYVSAGLAFHDLLDDRSTLFVADPAVFVGLCQSDRRIRDAQCQYPDDFPEFRQVTRGLPGADVQLADMPTFLLDTKLHDAPQADGA